MRREGTPSCAAIGAHARGTRRTRRPRSPPCSPCCRGPCPRRTATAHAERTSVPSEDARTRSVGPAPGRRARGVAPGTPVLQARPQARTCEPPEENWIIMGASALRAASRHALTLDDVTQLTAGMAYLNEQATRRRPSVSSHWDPNERSIEHAPLRLRVLKQVHHRLAGHDTGVDGLRHIGIRRQVALADARDAHLIRTARGTQQEPISIPPRCSAKHGKLGSCG